MARDSLSPLQKVQPEYNSVDLERERAQIQISRTADETAPLEKGEVASLSGEVQAQKKIRLTSKDPEGEEIKRTPIPGYAIWFDLESINEVEKKALPEFFTDSESEVKYKEIRNFMVSAFRSRPKEYLTVTLCRRTLTVDVGTIIRVHAFLEQWGLINHGIYFDTRGLNAPPVPSIPVIDNPRGFKDSSEDVLSAHHALVRSLARDNIPMCLSCELKDYKVAYKNKKDQQTLVCGKCFNDGKLPMNTSSTDYIRDGSSPETVWTDSETFLLLEGVEIFQDDWTRISQHVGSKSREECVLHFLKLPIQDIFTEKKFVESFLVESDMPFSMADNPLMAAVAFMASNVHSNVAAAAAEAALEQLKELKEVNSEAVLQKASATALASAGARAKELAENEDSKIRRLLMRLVELQTEKIQLKMKHYESLNEHMKEERRSIERQKAHLIAEKLQLKREIIDFVEKCKVLGLDEKAPDFVEQLKGVKIREKLEQMREQESKISAV